MTCSRCGGLCRVELARGRRGEGLVRLLACLICGDRTDVQIRWYRRQAEEARITQRWKELVWADVLALNRRRAAV